MGTGALVPPPTPGAEVEMRAEQLEKALGNALVNIQVRAQRRVEPFNRTRGPMVSVQQRLDRLEQFVAARTQLLGEPGVGAEEVALVLAPLAATLALVHHRDQSPDATGKGH